MIDIIQEESQVGAKIVVIGIGGAGNNALNRMIEEGIEGVEFIAMNTDQQALSGCKAPNKIKLGKGIRGAGAHPEVAEKAAEESADKIKEALNGAEMAFITCGMGKGTGTGASPVVARISKEMGILTVGIVTKPFEWEASRCEANARAGIEKISQYLDTMVVIPNDKLIDLVDRKDDLNAGFRMADSVLHMAVKGVTSIINTNELVNVDFEDIRTVMEDKGLGHIGIGVGTGDNRAEMAVEQAVNSPLLETTINSATDLLVNITGDVNLNDVKVVNTYITNLTGSGVNLITGLNQDKSEPDTCKVTLIATGLEAPSEQVSAPTFAKPVAGMQGTRQGAAAPHFVPGSAQGQAPAPQRSAQPSLHFDFDTGFGGGQSAGHPQGRSTVAPAQPAQGRPRQAETDFKFAPFMKKDNTDQ
ncbi:MAG: cell division protein FtsZ [Lachnospiraceae bacterium]|nr:cell division protein FtsZ [Lachnospiraceae bacterium]